MKAMRAAALVHAQQNSARQAQEHARSMGELMTRYKGATIRTTLAMVRPGGMASAMLARLKPRPLARRGGSDLRGASAVLAGNKEAGGVDGDEERGASAHDDVAEEEGPDAGAGHDKDAAPQDDSSDGGSSEESGDGDRDGAAPRRMKGRVRPVTAVRALSGIGPAGTHETDWAVAALAAGGAPALCRAGAFRLLQVAWGPGTKGWRRPWLGTVRQMHAASSAALFEANGFAGVRDLLVTLTAQMPPHRASANAMRQTFFCLLPLVLFDLQRPRTTSQRRDLLIRLAMLVRHNPLGEGTA